MHYELFPKIFSHFFDDDEDDDDDNDGKLFTQPEITCSKLTTATLKQGARYVQS